MGWVRRVVRVIGHRRLKGGGKYKTLVVHFSVQTIRDVTSLSLFTIASVRRQALSIVTLAYLPTKESRVN